MTILRFLGTGALLAASSCMLDGPSHTAQGQLYTSGNPTYDSFFRDVHQSQVDAASWDDDKKSARKSLVTSLELTPDAADVTIVQATHESSSKGAKAGALHLETDGTSAKVVANGAGGDPALFHAIEDTAHNELERAKKFHGVEPKLDNLLKQGNDLEGRVKPDFLKYGEMKANEVANELVASVDVLTKLKARADGEARASEDFVADLGRALETASEDRIAHEAGHHTKRHEEGTAAAAKNASASAKPATANAPAQPATAAPAQKPPDNGEVFTP